MRSSLPLSGAGADGSAGVCAPAVPTNAVRMQANAMRERVSVMVNPPERSVDSRPRLFAYASPWTYLDLAGRVPQLTKLDTHAGRNGAGLLLSLEAGEVGSLAPGERPAQAL